MKKIVIMVMVFLVACVSVTALAANKGNLRYSITVTKFKNEANWRGQWNLGNAFSTIMTDALNASGKFIVLGDKGMRREAMIEQDFVASGRTAKGKKAPKMKRMTPAQLLVRGSITHVESNTAGSKGGFRFKGIKLGVSSVKA
jgi:curli biogenesis system outer membrane secretion channel CsgG